PDLLGAQGGGSVVAVGDSFSHTLRSTRRCARSRLPCARCFPVVTAGEVRTSGTCPSATERRPRWPGPPSRPSPGAGAVLTSLLLLLPLSLYRWESGVLGQSFLDGLLQQAGQPPVLGDLQVVAQGLQRCGHLRPLLGAQPAGEIGWRVSGVCPALAPDAFGAPRPLSSPLGMDGVGGHRQVRVDGAEQQELAGGGVDADRPLGGSTTGHADLPRLPGGLEHSLIDGQWSS